MVKSFILHIQSTPLNNDVKTKPDLENDDEEARKLGFSFSRQKYSQAKQRQQHCEVAKGLGRKYLLIILQSKY